MPRDAIVTAGSPLLSALSTLAYLNCIRIRTKLEGTPEGEGLYLTVYPELSPKNSSTDCSTVSNNQVWVCFNLAEVHGRQATMSICGWSLLSISYFPLDLLVSPPPPRACYGGVFVLWVEIRGPIS